MHRTTEPGAEDLCPVCETWDWRPYNNKGLTHWRCYECKRRADRAHYKVRRMQAKHRIMRKSRKKTDAS